MIQNRIDTVLDLDHWLRLMFNLLQNIMLLLEGCHGRSGALGILRNELIPKEHVHLFKGFTFRPIRKRGLVTWQ